MRRIEAILFDKDGTLVDFEATWGPTYLAAGARLFDGDDAKIDSILRSGGLGEDGRFKAGSLLAAGSYRDIAEDWARYLPGRSTDDVLAELTPLLEQGAIANATPIVDLKALFQALRELGYILGIATNDTESSARKAMTRIVGDGLLDYVVGCDSGHGGKPEPGMMRAFCSHFGLAPESVAVVGDNIHDLEMGRRGGAGALIGVLSGASTAADFAAIAHHVIGDVGQLTTLFGKCVQA